jgi:hypothetical protein
MLKVSDITSKYCHCMFYKKGTADKNTKAFATVIVYEMCGFFLFAIVRYCHLKSAGYGAGVSYNLF